MGSLSELRTQIEICLEVYSEYEELITLLLKQCEEINKMLVSLIIELKKKLTRNKS